MRHPRWLISMVSLALLPAGFACAGGDAEEAPPLIVTRPPVTAPTAPGLPTAVSAVEGPTQPPATPTPTETPVAVIEPVATATEVPPEPTAPPADTATPEPPAAPLEFDPPSLVQGGAAIVYFNEAALAATMSFGGLQYPMLFDGARWWAMIGIGAFAEPGIAPVTVTYNPSDGSPQAVAEGSIEIVDRDFPVENIELDPETSALLDPAIVNNEEALRATIFSGYTTQRLWDGAFQGPSGAAISDPYGTSRSYNGGPITSFHRGTDFIGSNGDPVYAAASGRVVFAEELQVRGNSVVIDHGVGVFSTYNHLSAINVAVGDTVTAGQLIGQIGSTGLVTGPHLHWEVVVRGIEVDGELWLAGAVGP